MSEESIRKIKSAKLAKGRTLEVNYVKVVHVDAGNVENKISEKCEYLAHNDLIEAFKKLDAHLIAVCEESGLPEDFKVGGFTICDGNEGEGVIILGNRKLSTGKFLNLTSPMVDYCSGDYEDGEILEMDIAGCLSEIQLYLDGKCAIKQIEINFNEDDENTAPIIADGTEPKRKGRKKKATVEIFVDGGSLSGSTEGFEQN
jgi:hypothetical protein